jgi:hypothetical protein
MGLALMYGMTARSSDNLKHKRGYIMISHKHAIQAMKDAGIKAVSLLDDDVSIGTCDLIGDNLKTEVFSCEVLLEDDTTTEMDIAAYVYELIS